jgi:RNA polymerase sigma factor (sigma-70 family)
MASGQWGVVLRHVQRLFQGESVAGLSEGQLLERFASTRDEVAFGAILARHGPMVLGVCRGFLDDPRDVDDAFQATFLVLVKKAGALRESERLGQWLYGVARRVALRARSSASRRKVRERPEVEAIDEPRATLDTELRELQVLIREEVDRLPGNDRMAVVLCYLEGLTHEEAADRLGWPVGTVKGRLSRARDKLRDRLTRRGVALPAIAVGTALAKGASAAVPPELIRSTTLAATHLAAGQTLTAGIVSAQAITLMEGVIGTMFTTKLKLGAMALFATCAVGVPGVLAVQGPGDGPAKVQAPDMKKSQKVPALAGPSVAPTTRPGPDASLEEEARLSEQALQLVKQAILDPQASSRPSVGQVYVWSRRIAEARTGPKASPQDRLAALQSHRDRMRENVELVTELVRGEASMTTKLDLLEAKFHLVEADRWLRDGSIATLVQNSRIRRWRPRWMPRSVPAPNASRSPSRPCPATRSGTRRSSRSSRSRSR